MHSSTSTNIQTKRFIIAGIIVLLIGIAGILASLMRLLQTAHYTNLSILSALSVKDLFFDIGLVYLGISSMKAHRWSRTLLFLFSWYSAISILFGFVMCFWFAPFLAKNSTLIVYLIGFSLIMLINIVGIIFYGHRSTKTICEKLYPSSCWTDHCPTPVLAACLFLTIGLYPYTPTALLFDSYSFPLIRYFHSYQTMLLIPLLVLWAYGIWKIYQLSLIGWWIHFVSLIVIGSFNLIAYACYHIEVSFWRGTVTPAMLAYINSYNYWCLISPCLFLLAYLLWIKKYFTKPKH